MRNISPDIDCPTSYIPEARRKTDGRGPGSTFGRPEDCMNLGSFWQVVQGLQDLGGIPVPKLSLICTLALLVGM